MDWGNDGLNMGYITEFDMSLKLTWLRKLLQQSPDWMEFAVHYKIDRLIWIGTTYHDKLQNTISNPFWKSVSISFKKWYTLDKNNHIVTEFQPIWGNLKLNIEFNHILFKNNLIFIKDLFDAQDNPKTKLSLENSKGRNIMFTTYHAIWRAMPREWEEYMREIENSFNLTIPPVMSLLIRDTKGTKTLRRIWSLNQNSIIPIGQEKNGFWRYKTRTY